LRTDLEKKNDREIERAYQSTVKSTDKEEKKTDPWGDVPPNSTSGNQEQAIVANPARRFRPPWSVEDLIVVGCRWPRGHILGVQLA